MDLKWIKVAGFRRFHESSTLDLSGRLVALVGPNEAGKSSIIRVLSYVGNDIPVPPIEKTRGTEANIEIIASFYLNKSDLAKAELHSPSWLTITKLENGRRLYELTPKPPLRTVKHRKPVVTQIRRVTSNTRVADALETNAPNLIAQLNHIASQIEDGTEDLPPNLCTQMDQFGTQLSEQLPEQLPKYALNLQRKLADLAEIERRPNPNKFALDTLQERIPQFLEFEDEQRQLAAEYDIGQVVANPPAPIHNLASISGLDFTKLQAAIAKGDWAEKQNLLKPANERLLEAFRETWSQSSIHVHFEVEGNILKILIVDEEERFSTLGERSDGLRQFVALQAFTTVERVDEPILLIDEAEMHLHYDGQADLIQMLTRQNVTQKVIYTTHSTGCLPEDLGVGVRLVVPIAGSSTSVVRNKFWHSKEPGFSPLLFGMGATNLAFFPVRYAVVAEGPTDMLLLPTLFRHATGRQFLGFQVVPGLSETSLSTLPAMENSGERVAYFVDSDDGGEKLRQGLIKLGVNPNRIYNVSRPPGIDYTIEDFIAKKCFVKAVNSLLAQYHPKTSKLSAADLASPGRIDKLNLYCASNGIDNLSKTAIAYELLSIVGNDPTVTLVDSAFKAELRTIYRKITRELGILN